MAKMNEAVDMKNSFTMDGVGKQLVHPFKRQELWKCIGFVLPEFNYGKKGRKLWSEVPKASCRMASTKLRRNIRGNTDLYKVCCDIYWNFYIYAWHWVILSYTTSFISWMFLWVLNSIYPLQVCGISLTRFKKFRTFLPCYFIDPSVKGTNNFWKIRGLIGGFNNSRRHIASGVKKTAYELMSAI